MKNKLQRFLSSLLTIAILVSMLSVFAFATEAPEQPKSDEVRVIYSRNFDEGWDLTNGFTVSHGSNNLGID